MIHHSRHVIAVRDQSDDQWGMREFGVSTSDGHRLMIGCFLTPARGD